MYGINNMGAHLSTTSKQPLGGVIRQSNIELLRIIAMFMVLAVHANYWSLGTPSA